MSGRGRGEYYKQKYGGGGRGGGRGGGGGGRGGGRGGGGGYQEDSASVQGGGNKGPPRSADDLRALLRRIDGAPYPAYRDMEHAPFDFGGRVPFRLSVDRAQSDPFAPPTRMHVVVAGDVANFPPESYSTPTRAVALADYLSRMFVRAAKAAGDDQRVESGGWQGKKGGEITMEAPGQHVLARTSVIIDVRGGGWVEARFTVALPARGRSIEGLWCSKILLERLPDLVARSLLFSSLDAAHLRAHILSVEDQEVLRSLLPSAGLVGFIRNGALLPRKSGHVDLPMDAATALPFQSPHTLEREVTLPNAGKVKGMGIPKGITLIVGGGFHGKSTVRPPRLPSPLSSLSFPSFPSTKLSVVALFLLPVLSL